MRSTLVLAFALLACQKAASKLDNMSNGSGMSTTATGSGSSAAVVSPTPSSDNAIDLDSKDILARTDVAKEVTVKHVLIGWKDLPAARDPRVLRVDRAVVGVDRLPDLLGVVGTIGVNRHDYFATRVHEPCSHRSSETTILLVSCKHHARKAGKRFASLRLAPVLTSIVNEYALQFVACRQIRPEFSQLLGQGRNPVDFVIERHNN